MHAVIKKTKGLHGIREKIKLKTITLDTQVNLAESDKGSFYNQKEWLEEYEYGKGIFYSKYDDCKNCTSSEHNDGDWRENSSEEDESSDSNAEELFTAYTCRIIFSLLFFPFSFNLLLLLSGFEKRLLQSIHGTKK